ncbi:MAG: redox-sensitive bicupin YhaK (pirin superfamily) [Patiriisocius sp.]|jgi:redox-sensitive bicupin YhaK (pirin superfamily)
MQKSVKTLIPSFDVNMGGIILKQALPTQNVPQVDPFLLLHHARFTFNNNSKAIHQGLGPHPHRGFTPVTFVIDGEVHHRDSRGNSQIAKKGEVQWMHAGAGIIHSERPSQALVETEGTQEVIQLWINSPAVSKMDIPRYQYIPENHIPVFKSSDMLVTTKVISGDQKEVEGPIIAVSEVLVLWANAQKDGTESFTIPEGHHSMLYVISGSVSISEYGLVEAKSLAIFENNGNNISIEARSNASFLILAGQPTQEKLVQQGPFVMNTETEILEANRDYRMGKMGILIEE